MNLIQRPRRLRNGSVLRSMVRETRISADTLIYPMFVMEGTNIKEEIATMPGQYRWSIDRMDEILQELTDAGVKSVLLFGIPKKKDEIGSSAWAEDGIVQQAIRHIKQQFPQLYVITDVCMCEYTSHGHCGILCGHSVDNDQTLEVLAKTALSHVQAGADMVAPSDMMDGRVGKIRAVLDENGFSNTPIMSYSVKYASAFYGPFRDAAGSAPAFGDGSTQLKRSDSRSGTGHSRRCRYLNGEARYGIFGCAVCIKRTVPISNCNLQCQWRICNDKSSWDGRLCR